MPRISAELAVRGITFITDAEMKRIMQGIYNEQITKAKKEDDTKLRKRRG